MLNDFVQNCIIPDLSPLSTLIDDLEGALCVIAYDNGAHDPTWIQKRQQEIKATYELTIKSIRPLTSSFRGFYNVANVYWEFLDILVDPHQNLTVTELQERANHIVQGYIIAPANEHLIETDEERDPLNNFLM